MLLITADSSCSNSDNEMSGKVPVVKWKFKMKATSAASLEHAAQLRDFILDLYILSRYIMFKN